MTRTEDDLRAAYEAPVDQSALDRLARLVGELASTVGSAAPRHRSRQAWLAPLFAAVGIVVLAVGIALAVGHHDASRPATGTTPVASAIKSSVLQLWAKFPVDASPRPLVLTGTAVNDPSTGFPNGDDKIAYLAGNFELGVALPATLSTADGQKVITSADALAVLRASGGAPPATASLTITAVQLGVSTFSTDRGRQLLPAWSFHFAGVAQPASVLAVPPSERWSPSGSQNSRPALLSATIAADGQHIEIGFTGSPAGTGPCNAQYAAVTAQTATAVAVAVREIPNPSASSITACAAVGASRTVAVTLTSPLGNRVLVDANGTAIPAS